jgi:hypothetical protein
MSTNVHVVIRNRQTISEGTTNATVWQEMVLIVNAYSISPSSLFCTIDPL